MPDNNNAEVLKLKKDNFEETISGDKPVLVDFFATWCGPCQMMAPILDELAREEADKRFKVCKLDIDQAPEIAAKYDVMSVPTMMVFTKGKETLRLVGAMTKDMLVNKIIDAIK